MEWLKDWVRDRISDAKGVLSKAIDGVREMAEAGFDTIARVFRPIRTVFGRLAGALKNFRAKLGSFVHETYSTIKWLSTVEIPRRVKQVLNDAIKWASGRIEWVRGELKSIVASLDKWARSAVKTLNDWARAAVKWVTDRANWLYQQWTTFVRDVLPRLLSPTRLIDWVWGATVAKFWRWLPSQADRLTDWVLKRSLSFTLWLGEYLLRYLGRLL